MSIKIFNGYSIDMDMSFIELNNFIKKLRREIEKNAIEMAELEIAFNSAYLIDIHTLFGNSIKEFNGYNLGNLETPPFFNAWLRGDRIQREKYKDDKHLSNYHVDAIFTPIEGKTLILFNSSCNLFIRTLEEMEGVMEYRYFDNTDKPDDISDGDWDRRRCDWEKALPTCLPYKSGVVAEFLNGFPFFTDISTKRLNDIELDFEKRIKDMSHLSVLREFTLKKMDEEMEFEDFVMTNEYEEMKKEKENDIKKRLKENIDLTKWKQN